jgi:hypothetical protein
MTDPQILISSNEVTYVANLKERWLFDYMYSEEIYSNMTLEPIWIYRMWTGSSMSLSMWVTLILKSFIFLDIMLWSPVEVSRHFRGTYHPHPSGLRNEPNKKPAWRWQQTELCLLSKKPAWSKQIYFCILYVGFLFGLFAICEDAGYIFLHSSVAFTGLYSIMSLKTEFFITASVRTANPTIHSIWQFIQYLAVLNCDFHIIQI